MDKIRVKVSQDFSGTPGPRYPWEGNFSGEDFRKNVLFPKVREALQSQLKIVVDLDGTAGYGTSFLEESFGGLVRKENIGQNELLSILELVSEEEDFWKERIIEYIKKARNEPKEKQYA